VRRRHAGLAQAAHWARLASICSNSRCVAAGSALTISSRLARALARVVTSTTDIALAFAQVS